MRTRHGVIHHNWLRSQRLGRPTLQLTYDAARATLATAEDRRDRLDEAITQLAHPTGRRQPVHPMVDRLACLGGISTLTGFGLTVEIGDWSRLAPDTVGAYLGLVLSEDSTGESRSQGGVTKTGTSHARRLHARWRAFDARHKRPVAANTAIARELAGWCWAPAVMDPDNH